MALATTVQNELHAASHNRCRLTYQFGSLIYQPVVLLHTAGITFPMYLGLLTAADAFVAASLREAWRCGPTSMSSARRRQRGCFSSVRSVRYLSLPEFTLVAHTSFSFQITARIRSSPSPSICGTTKSRPMRSIRFSPWAMKRPLLKGRLVAVHILVALYFLALARACSQGLHSLWARDPRVTYVHGLVPPLDVMEVLKVFVKYDGD